MHSVVSDWFCGHRLKHGYNRVKRQKKQQSSFQVNAREADEVEKVGMNGFK